MSHQTHHIGAQFKEVIGAALTTAGAATENGTGVDRTKYGSGVLSLQTGAVTGSPTSFTVTAKIQDSADNSSFADFGTDTVVVIAANSIGRLKVNLAGARQYVRVSVTTAFVGGTSPTVARSSTLILGGGVEIPVV